MPGVCNFNPETTMLAHLSGGGMGMKRLDTEAAYCCSDCHDALDRRTDHLFGQEELKVYHFEGVMRTQRILIAKGLVIIK